MLFCLNLTYSCPSVSMYTTFPLKLLWKKKNTARFNLCNRISCMWLSTEYHSLDTRRTEVVQSSSEVLALSCSPLSPVKTHKEVAHKLPRTCLLFPCFVSPCRDFSLRTPPPLCRPFPSYLLCIPSLCPFRLHSSFFLVFNLPSSASPFLACSTLQC